MPVCIALAISLVFIIFVASLVMAELLFLQHARSLRQDCGKVVERTISFEITQNFFEIRTGWTNRKLGLLETQTVSGVRLDLRISGRYARAESVPISVHLKMGFIPKLNANRYRISFARSSALLKTLAKREYPACIPHHERSKGWTVCLQGRFSSAISLYTFGWFQERLPNQRSIRGRAVPLD